MIRSFTLSLLAALLFLAPLAGHASHISGVDISWECLGNNQYRVNLNLFRDCSGINMAATETVYFQSTCGQSFNVQMPQGPGSGTEISQLCPLLLPQSTCGNGNYPGMQAYTYTAIVTLNPPCDTWRIYWSRCCRNTAVNCVGSINDNMYAEAILYTNSFPCNHSPVFSAQPIPYVCLNQPVTYNYGVYDPDSDSLVYVFIAARSAQATPLTYAGGYSGALPIPGITLDPATGIVNFTPTQTGNFIVAIRVDQYTHNGVLIGSTMRDMQFTVINCFNTQPDPPLSIQNLSGQAVQLTPNQIELCGGSQFCLDIVFSDPDVNDILTITSNVGSVLANTTVTQTGTNPATATICATSIPGFTFVAFTVFAEDDACPVTGLSSFTVVLSALPGTLVQPANPGICTDGSIQLVATGGNIFDWQVISGPPMQLGTNFSCTPCEDPVATPVSTTTYVVTSDLNATCNTDTVTVTVYPDFTFSIIQDADTTCLLDPVQLDIVANPNWAGYTYAWSPATYLSDPNIRNPVITPGASGTLTYTVTVTSPDGCPHVDSTTVYVAPVDIPDVTALVSTTIPSCGDTVYLDVDVGTSVLGQLAFNWGLGSTVSNPGIQQPFAISSGPATFTVVVTNTWGGCTDTSNVYICSLCGPSYTPIVSFTDITCFNASDGTLTATIPNGVGLVPPFTYDLYLSGTVVATSPVANNHTFTGLGPGTYQVVLTDGNGCSSDTTVTLVQPDLLTIATTDTTICLSNTAILDATVLGGNGGYVLTWNQGLAGNGPHVVQPATTTVYSVFVTDALGCTTAPVNSTVTVNPPLNLSVVVPDSICIGDSPTLVGIGAGGNGGPYTFVWEEVGVGIVGNGPNPQVTPTDYETDYLVTLTDNCGTPSVNTTFHISWYRKPEPDFVADILEDCFPAAITFTNLTQPLPNGTQCVWDFGDGNTAVGCGQVTNSFANVGCYDVTLTVFNPAGCPGDTTFIEYVCARPYPTAQFTWSPMETNVLDPIITFTNNSINDVSWQWDFGPLALPPSSQSPNETVMFPETDEGWYPVWLRVTNIYGCPDSVMYTVHINGFFTFYVPNTFTPDNDGVNDLFGPIGQGFEGDGFRMDVYDRWGSIIHTSTQHDKHWDGRLANGQPAPDGIYAWKVRTRDRYTGGTKEFVGHVTLLR